MDESSMESEMMLSIIVGAVVFGAALYVFLRKTRVGGAAAAVVGIKKPRTLNSLIGLTGAGKTALFLRLIGKTFRPTNSSMTMNRFSIPDSNGEILADIPGNRRQRNALLEILHETKRLVVVVDSITIQDDRNAGVQALAELLCDAFQSAGFSGVKGVLFACTKRDDLTSFSSKAVRRFLETEMARELKTREAAVGTLHNVAGVKAAKSSAISAKDDVLLYVREDGKFSFDDVCVPCTFADVSAVGDAGAAEGCDSNDVFGFEVVRKFVLGIDG